MQQIEFWRLGSLSHAALLDGLSELVGSSRQTLARLLAHLGEVEERRLHLDMGFASMFVYCVQRLGLSEDEAARRIEVARLARRHPELFSRIASGQVSLSVAALLKPHLTEENAATLFELVSGSTVARAREQLAAHFPRPDVPSTLRKLPERSCATTRAPLHAPATCAAAIQTIPIDSRDPLFARVSAPVPMPEASSTPNPLPACPERTIIGGGTSASARRNIEPLSNGRYKLQLTADTALKQKLELARDLMRHAQPDGDLAPILSRALDLLLEQLMKRRFGARSSSASRSHGASAPAAGAPVEGSTPTAPQRANPQYAAPQPAAPPPPNIPEPHPTSASPSRRIPRATRRIVAERDGLRCTWQGPDGTRCETSAWLETDHARPHGRGGDASPQNLRLLCRAHNRRAAEMEYGRKHIDDCIARARSQNTREPQRPSGPIGRDGG